MIIDERTSTERAAQLWTKPQFANKVMDADFAMAIKEELDDVIVATVDKAIAIATKLGGSQELIFTLADLKRIH